MIYKKWTPEDLDYLKEHYPNTDNLVLADYFGVSKDKLQSKANVIGVRKTEEFVSEMRSKVIELKGQNINRYTHMLDFGNSLEKDKKHKRLGPIFDKYGFYQFKEMYKLHTA